VYRKTEGRRLKEFSRFAPEGGGKGQKIWRKNIGEAMAPKRAEAPWKKKKKKKKRLNMLILRSFNGTMLLGKLIKNDCLNVYGFQ